GKKWVEILAQAQRQGRPVRLLIDAATDAVRDLPYGLLCEPHDDYFLLRAAGAGRAVQLVRIVRRCTPRLLRLGKPVRVLLAAAEPRAADVPSFDAPARLHALAQGLAASCEIWVCPPGQA